MRAFFELTSSQNPKIKQVLALRERKERDASGLFLIEGYRELRRAVDGGVKIESLFVSPPLFLGENEEALIKDTEAKTFSLPENLFRKISYRDRPDGLLAIGQQMQTTLESIKLRNKVPFFVVAEAIEKPGNLGTILRSADAVGVDAVIVCDRCTDIYNPNVVRASVGTLFTIPVIETTSQMALSFLQARKIHIAAATPAAKQEYTQANFKEPFAIVVGTEQLGLSSFWMESATCQVRIPMRGVADSLNVSTATTLLLYEVIRQRHLVL